MAKNDSKGIILGMRLTGSFSLHSLLLCLLYYSGYYIAHGQFFVFSITRVLLITFVAFKGGARYITYGDHQDCSNSFSLLSYKFKGM